MLLLFVVVRCFHQMNKIDPVENKKMLLVFPANFRTFNIFMPQILQAL